MENIAQQQAASTGAMSGGPLFLRQQVSRLALRAGDLRKVPCGVTHLTRCYCYLVPWQDRNMLKVGSLFYFTAEHAVLRRSCLTQGLAEDQK